VIARLDLIEFAVSLRGSTESASKMDSFVEGAQKLDLYWNIEAALV
jgi:hypothetical protein